MTGSVAGGGRWPPSRRSPTAGWASTTAPSRPSSSRRHARPRPAALATPLAFTLVAGRLVIALAPRPWLPLAAATAARLRFSRGVAAAAQELSDCKTIIWNGPMGVFEFDKFAAGTNAVAQTLAECTSKVHARTPRARPLAAPRSSLLGPLLR